MPWLPFLACGALGFAVALAFIWLDMERRRPGTVLTHLIWLLTSATCAVSVLGRTGVDISGVTAVLFGAAPALVAVAAFVTYLLRPLQARSGLLFAFLVYGGVSIVSAIVHAQITPVLAKSAGLLYLPGLAVVAWCSRAELPAMVALVRRVSLGVVYASLTLVIVAPAWAGIDGLPRRVPLPGVDWRVAGVTPHPNLLTIVAGLGLILVVHHRGKRWPLHVLATLACIAVGETRNIAVGLGIALVVMWLVAGQSVPGRILISAPVLALGGYLIVTMNEDSGLADDVATLNSRTRIWEVAAHFGPQQPILGWGPFAFDRAVETPFSTGIGGREAYFQHAHNQVIQTAIDAGIVGLAAFAAIAVLVFRMSFRTPREPVLCAVTTLVSVYAMTEVPFTVQPYGPSFVVPILALIFTVWAAFDRSRRECGEAGPHAVGPTRRLASASRPTVST